MRRRYRWLLTALAIAVTLLVLAVAGVMLWVDPNRFRGTIERAARDKLGVPLQLTGELHWSLWPLLSIEAGAGSMPPVLRWDRLQFGAQWRALWQQQVLIDRVSVDGLAITLQRDRTGQGNWQGWLAPVPAGGARAAVQVARLRLSKGSVRYVDDLAGAQWNADSLQLTTGVVMDAAGQLTLTGTNLSMLLRGGPLPGAGLSLSLQAPQLVYHPEPATVSIAPLALQAANATLALSFGDPVQLTPLVAAGSLEINTRALRSTLAMLEIVSPPTRDRAVLGPLHAVTQWRFDGVHLELDALQMQLDDTKLQGQVNWPLEPGKQASVDLHGDRLDVDRYLRPTDDPGKPFELPIAALRALRLQGLVSIDELRGGGTIARGARIRAESDD